MVKLTESIEVDTEFKEVEGKTILRVVRYNGNLVIWYTDGSSSSIFNTAEIRDGSLELAIKNYDMSSRE